MTRILSLLLLLGLPPLLFAQGGGGDPQQPPTETSFFDLLKKGGPVMWPLALCSVLGMTFIIERAISLRRSRLVPDGFLDGLFSTFSGRKEEHENGLAYCKGQSAPVGEIFASGMQAYPRGIGDAEEAIADTGGRVLDRLVRSLGGLKLIAQISPLLGLLGTVYGMIGAFQQLAFGSGDTSKSEKLAKGIYEALVTTATGLTIAIPVLIAYFLLRRQIEGAGEEIDQLRERFVNHYAGEEAK